MIISLLNDCCDLAECNCNYCVQSCILYQKLKEQGIDETPEILNTLREMFLEEYRLRVSAIQAAPRFSELIPEEYNKILSNSNHFRFNEDDDLVALY